MLIHLASKGRRPARDTFINFRETAPGAATSGMYLDAHGNVVASRSTKGWLSVAVPGTVMGLERARSEYGTRSLAKLIAPAIALARNGYVLGPGDAQLFDERTPAFRADPETRATFTHDGRALETGERLRQPALAHTLELIEHGGVDAFYRGPIARALVIASARHGGILSRDDLARYRAEELAPVRCAYHAYTVVTAPPPSSGGTTMCEILNILEPEPIATWGWGDPRTVHTTVEAERRAYIDRNAYLGDPDFVRNPLDRLLSPAYAAHLRADILTNRSTPSRTLRPGLAAWHEGTDTTHFSIADAAGDAVSVTYTINDLFGSGVMAEGTGFLLNDEMDDFTSKPGVPNLYGLVQGSANAIAPGKRPLSSMAPTIVLRANGDIAMVAGSPGGSRIITITLGVVQNVLDHGMDVQKAVDAPRIHEQGFPDTVYEEAGALTLGNRHLLEGMGYGFTRQPDWGVAEAIVVDPQTGAFSGGTDRRRTSSAALGY